MIYAVSDLHGYPFEKFKKLLDKVGFCEKDTLYILGDVVDRGKDGVKYLQWVMEQPNVRMILGNHELMMRQCDFLFEPNALELMKDLNNEQRVNLSIWMANGAENTVRGLFAVSQEEREAIFRFLNELPLYECVSTGGTEYVLTHSGMRDFSPQKPLDEYSANDLVWNRPDSDERYFDDKITVFGHTPTFFFGEDYRGEIVETDTWIDIDAGAGYGICPILFRLFDKKQFTL